MTNATKTPWHLWAVGIFGILWTSMGAMDFVLTQGGSEAYLSQFSPEERTFFTGIPGWAVVFWGLSIGTGILGSLVLLFRSRLAVPIYWVSLASFIIVSIQNYLIASPNMLSVVGTFASIFSLVIFLVVVGLLYYAMRMQARGVLR